MISNFRKEKQASEKHVCKVCLKYHPGDQKNKLPVPILHEAKLCSALLLSSCSLQFW